MEADLSSCRCDSPRFQLRPPPGQPWSRANHFHPCPETDHIDAVLNELRDTTVTLSPQEKELARRLGRARREQSTQCHDRQVSSESPLFIDTMGVLGEMAVCQYLGIPYQFTVNTYRAADLPHNIEVRATQWLNGHCKVQQHDPDDRRVVMAIITTLDGPVILPGWITARAGKTFRLWDTHNVGMPWHCVPKEHLKPMFTLKDLIL